MEAGSHMTRGAMGSMVQWDNPVFARLLDGVPNLSARSILCKLMLRRLPISPDAAIGTVTRIREEDCTVCSRFYSAWEQRGGCGGGGGCERGRGSVRSFVCLLSRMGELILLRRREAIDLRLRSGLEM